MPKRVDHDERRRAIAEALVRIASTRGVHAASMREVAAEAGVSVRLVQYYFRSKEELLQGAVRLLGEQVAARVQRRVQEMGLPTTPRKVIYGVLTALVPSDDDSRRIMLAATALHMLQFTEPKLAALAVPAADALEAFLGEQVREAQAAGDLADEHDQRGLAATLLALAGGLTSQVLGGQRSAEAAMSLLKTHLDRLFR